MMRKSTNLIEGFDRLDTRINTFLVAHSIHILRFCLGLVFLGFGILKFFDGISPIQALATRTTTILTLGYFSGHNAMLFVAILETIIGFCFLTGLLLRVGVWLMAIQMLGAMAPLVLYPAQLFSGPHHAPTLEAQYIIKDIILIAAAMVIASTWTGAKIVSKPQSFRSALRKPADGVYSHLSGSHTIR